MIFFSCYDCNFLVTFLFVKHYRDSHMRFSTSGFSIKRFLCVVLKTNFYFLQIRNSRCIRQQGKIIPWCMVPFPTRWNTYMFLFNGISANLQKKSKFILYISHVTYRKKFDPKNEGQKSRQTVFLSFEGNYSKFRS